jgi:hypothetical protein
MDGNDPRDEIERLEAQIEQLAARIESCRKFILAARIAMAGGGGALVAMLFGLLEPDLTVMTAAMGALLGGIVVGGANASTAKEAQSELAAAEKQRAALIGMIDLRVVGGRDTLH